MADIFFEEFTRCAKVCGLLFLDSGFLLLIGWAKTPAKPQLRPGSNVKLFMSIFLGSSQPFPCFCLHPQLLEIRTPPPPPQKKKKKNLIPQSNSQAEWFSRRENNRWIRWNTDYKYCHVSELQAKRVQNQNGLKKKKKLKDICKSAATWPFYVFSSISHFVPFRPTLQQLGPGLPILTFLVCANKLPPLKVFSQVAVVQSKNCPHILLFILKTRIIVYSEIEEALSVLMLCTPVFIFTSGSSVLLGRPHCGLLI